MPKIMLASPSKEERNLGPYIRVENSPASLNTKDNKNAHLERGQAVFRAFLTAFPDPFTTVLNYTEAQAGLPVRIVKAIFGRPSEDTSNGDIYIAPGNDRSTARIKNPKDGFPVYEHSAIWGTTLRNLELSAQRTDEGKKRLETERKLAEPFGLGTGHFAEYVARIHAIDVKVLGSDRFWQKLVEYTHLTSDPPLKPDGFWARLGNSSLYTINLSPQVGRLPDAIVGIRVKEGGVQKSINQRLRHLGRAEDQHGQLLLFGEVANVQQPAA